MTEISDQAKRVGQSFEDIIQKVTKFYLASLPIRAVQLVIRETTQTIQEFDKAFTELSKVIDLSGEELNKYVDNLSDIGTRVARTKTELIDAVTTATKAGFNPNEAKIIAEYSALLQNTFDEAVTGSEATSILVSQLKAFNMEASEAGKVLDIINKVSATQAVTSGDLANALKISSSALQTYNNSLEESVALVTAGTTIEYA